MVWATGMVTRSSPWRSLQTRPLPRRADPMDSAKLLMGAERSAQSLKLCRGMERIKKISALAGKAELEQAASEQAVRAVTRPATLVGSGHPF